MKTILLLVSLLSSQVLLADMKSDMKNDFETEQKYPPLIKFNAFSPTVEIGATRYNLSINGNVFNRSINYDIVEAALGFSYTTEDWIFAVYRKEAVREIQTNSFVALTGKSDDANIDRKEWVTSLTYTKNIFRRTDNTSDITYNIMYFNSELDAQNSYVISDSLNKKYNYKTQGVNMSATYSFTRRPDGSEFFGKCGLLYTKADLDFKEYRNGLEENRYVNDTVDTWGLSLGTGYKWKINNSLYPSIVVDWNYLDFGNINISEKDQGVLTQNTFTENTLSFRLGLDFRF